MRKKCSCPNMREAVKWSPIRMDHDDFGNRTRDKVRRPETHFTRTRKVQHSQFQFAARYNDDGKSSVLPFRREVKRPQLDDHHLRSSMIQSNPGLFPSSPTHLEWNDGPASICDIDLDICARSSSPTSDALEGASSTTASSPSDIPPDEKAPEKEAVIMGGTTSSLLCVWEDDEAGRSPRSGIKCW